MTWCFPHRIALLFGWKKRSGAFLFLLYLRQEGMALSFDENGVAALTLIAGENA